MDKQLEAIELFQLAKRAYKELDFDRAVKLSNQYKKQIDYSQFERIDKRQKHNTSVSIIIVTYGGRKDLIDCIDSIEKQRDDDFEIILVDNGYNEKIYKQISKYNMLHIYSPINLNWTEGRNLGTYFARGKYLAFIDDDGILKNDYITHLKSAWEIADFLAIRGKILPKINKNNLSTAGHYDFGDYPIPAVLMAEGNMAIKSDVFRDVDGFDPLILGGEGTELTGRLQRKYPGRDIYYWPKLVMYHDYAKGKNMIEKKKRHAITAAYFSYLSSGLNELQGSYNDWYKDRPTNNIVYDRRKFKDKIAAKTRSIAFKLFWGS
jgi:GT2 family glycosyltransferase